MLTFLSAAKNTQPKGNLPQYGTVRSSSFQLRALHNTNETIHTSVIRCLTTKTTSEMSLSDFGVVPAKHRQNSQHQQGGHHLTYPFRSPRNTDRTRGDILVLSWLAFSRANRGRPRHLRSGWNEEHLFVPAIYHIHYQKTRSNFPGRLCFGNMVSSNWLKFLLETTPIFQEWSDVKASLCGDDFRIRFAPLLLVLPQLHD